MGYPTQKPFTSPVSPKLLTAQLLQLSISQGWPQMHAGCQFSASIAQNNPQQHPPPPGNIPLPSRPQPLHHPEQFIPPEQGERKNPTAKGRRRGTGCPLQAAFLPPPNSSIVGCPPILSRNPAVQQKPGRARCSHLHPPCKEAPHGARTPAPAPQVRVPPRPGEHPGVLSPPSPYPAPTFAERHEAEAVLRLDARVPQVRMSCSL